MAAITSAVIIGAAAMANANASNSAADDANARAAAGEFTGGSFTGPGGSASIEFGPGGEANLTTGLGAFGDSFSSLLEQAGGFFGGNAGGSGDLMALLQQFGQSSIGDIRRSEQLLENTLANSDDFNVLGEQFQNDIRLAQQDTGELGRSIASQFQPALDRAQGNLRNTTFDRLFSSGKFANSQAASPVVEGLSRQFGEQQVQLQDFGRQQALSQQQDAFGRALSSSQQREAIGGRQFGESFSSAQLLSQNAQDRFGIGSGLFSQFLQNQQQQQGLGIQALGTSANLSQLPLAFLNAIQSAGALRSDSILGSADIMQRNVAGTTNPFAEGLLGGFSAFGAANPDAFSTGG